MAFTSEIFNPIGGVTGYSNLWEYGLSPEDLATITAVSFFDDSVSFGLKDGDSILVAASDGSGIRRVDIAAGVVTLSAFV